MSSYNISQYIYNFCQYIRKNNSIDISDLIEENIFLKSGFTNDMSICYYQICDILCQLTESNFAIIMNYNESQKIKIMYESAYLYQTKDSTNPLLNLNAIFPIVECFIYQIIENFDHILIDNKIDLNGPVKNVCFMPLCIQNKLSLIICIGNKMNGEYCLVQKQKLYSLLTLLTNLIQMMKIFQQSIESKKQQLLDSREMFLANISHEIRTPLNAIAGITELLLCSESLSTMNEKYLRVIQDCGNQLLMLINDIIDYSKIAADKIILKHDEFNLLTLIDHCIQMITLEANKKKINILKDIHSNVPQYIIGDAKRIKQVLLNILWNAVKFTNDGSITILVKIASVSKSHNSVLNSIKSSSIVNIIFSITDTGIGIDDDKQSYIFNLFGQIEQKGPVIYEGLGLGLAISKKLVNLHGGDISVTSKLNVGSTFTFNFVVEQISLNTDLFKFKKVLIIDEDPTNRLLYLRLFKEWQLTPIIATNGKEVLLLMDMHNFDVILLDIHIKGEIDGIQIAKSIYQNNANVIALCNNKTIEKSMQQFHFQLIKPVKKNDLYNVFMDIFGDTNNNRTSSSDSTDFKTLEIFKNNDDCSISTINILIGEDCKVNRMVLEAFLRKLNFKNIDLVCDGEEVLQQITMKQYDILLLDIKMPNMDGYQTILQLKKMVNNQKLNKLPIIIAQTAHALETEKEKCLELGFNDYLTKPFTIQAINEMIHKYF